MISLIANTGIQFHTFKFSIDIKSGQDKMYFYEWFDSNENKLKLDLAHFFSKDDVWVKKKELATYGYLRDGKPTDEWSEIKKDGIREITQENKVFFNTSISNCQIEEFDNEWLPFPFFELNSQNKTSFGPINWCRIRFSKIQSSNTNVQDYEAVIAFDTRSIYIDDNVVDEDRETPVFSSDFEKYKSYGLCDNEFQLIDFCSENYKCDWVNKHILKLIHQTDKVDALRAPKLRYLTSYIFLIHHLQKVANVPNVRLYRDREVQWSNVDIAIDIGNSKTSAILFDEGDFTKVRSLELQDLSNPQKTYCDPFDMRLAFHKANFGNFGIVDSRQFVFPSFVRLGKEGGDLIYKAKNENSGKERTTTFSSPKRFLWDKKQYKVEWEFIQIDTEERESIWLNGISQQFNKDGSINVDGKGGRSNSYSRSSLMTFAFLEILSQAQMQINSFKYRDEIGDADKPRKIDRIIITCPTAMSRVEQSSLRKCAEEAAIVLQRYNLNNFESPFEYKEFAKKVKIIPEQTGLTDSIENKNWIYDEATCSQFVFLFAEIAKRHLNNSKEYFELYGKVRDDLKDYTRHSLTVGSVDIGAGTTDVMICAYEYSESGQTTLKPIPLFWESFYYAGDDLLKEFVHQFIIEGQFGAIKNKLKEIGKENESQALLSDFFGPDHSRMSFRDRQYRKDFNIQVSLPIALKFLELAQKNVLSKVLSFQDIFNSGNFPNEKVLNHFEGHFGFSFMSISWNYKAENANPIIIRTFEPLLQKIAGLMYAYKCDFVLLAGRPTSLKQIEDLFLKFYPVAPNRLKTLNNYRVGRWYPFQDGDGYFENQKSIVSIGAMIGYIASAKGGLDGFSLDLSDLIEKFKPTTDYFGLLNEQTRRFKDALLSPTNNHAKFEITSLPIKLGCRQLDTEAYPTRVFYLLDFNFENIADKIRQKGITDVNQIKEHIEKELLRIRSKMPLTITILRENFVTDKETILLDSVFDVDQNDLPLNYFNLHVQSMSDAENFWLDSGEFKLDIRLRK